jgi:hypothetical protein
MATAGRHRREQTLTLRPGLGRAALAGAVAAITSTSLAACEPTTGSSSSSESSTQTVVVISAADDVCWQATVDGRVRKGCGDARFTDRSGRATAKVLKTTNGARVRVRLVVAGRTVDSGSVQGRMHYVTVAESSDG